MTADSGAYRILDANLNRAREGLRVCEEIARFVLSSAAVSRELKLMRHGVAASARELPRSPLLLASRDSREDVGRASKLASEMRRTGYRDIFAANMQRVKESLRVLEEFSKLYDQRVSVRFRRLRFRAYELERRAAVKMAGRAYS